MDDDWGIPWYLYNVNPGLINPKRLFNWGGYHFTSHENHYLGEPPQLINQGLFSSGVDIIVFL